MSEVGHGNMVAAWVAVSIIMAAFVIGGIAILMGVWPLFWASVVLAAVGGVAGKVLQMMGFGQGR
jgi:hypothetical protein